MSVDQEQALNDYLVWEMEGGLNYESKVELFQRLINLDLVDQIDSRFQNQAFNLIASGECTPPRQEVEVEDDGEERINA